MTTKYRIQRIALTTLVCFIASIISFWAFLKWGENLRWDDEFFPYFIAGIVPFLFSLALSLTNYDQVRLKNKHKAVLLAAIFSPVVFFVSFGLFLLLGSILQPESITWILLVISIFSSIAIILTTAVYIKLPVRSIDLLISLIAGVAVAAAWELLSSKAWYNYDFPEEIIFVIWQTINGLAISLYIWRRRVFIQE